MDELIRLAHANGVSVTWGRVSGGLGRYDAKGPRIILDDSLRFDPILARAVLAHELGHHYTRHLAHDKEQWEAAARAWALRYLIPDSRAREVWERAVMALVEEAAVPPAWAAARLLEVIM